MRRTILSLVVVGFLIHLPAPGQAPDVSGVGIDEKLGERIPLEELTFIGEDGEPVHLASLFDRPVILTLVYFRCAGICTPLLQDMSRLVDITESTAGEDYRVVSISFDPKDTADLARVKKANLLATMKNREIDPGGWRFLTGDKETIGKLTEAVGFQYVPDNNKVDFIHVGALIFLSRDGVIVRYLNGIRFNPADIELALVDATEGRARSFMQKMQAFCYTYDPEGRGYVLKVNRIILGVTVLFALLFCVYLFIVGVRRKAGGPRSSESVP